MEARRSILLGFALALLFTSGLALLMLRADVPSLDVRVQPWQFPAGKLFPGHAIGQGFVCTEPTLSRIEVALVRQPGDSPRELKLTLRAEDARGEILREAIASPELEPGSPRYVAFSFAALEEAEGKRLHFELACAQDNTLSDWSPWISWRGRSGAGLPWGDRFAAGDALSSELKVVQDRWSGVALAVDGLNVPAGECRLDIVNLEDGTPQRTSRIAHASPIAAGYALFEFEPIERSRWRDYRLEFTLPEDARVVATEQGLSAICLHGTGDAPESLIGMTRAGASLAHRDLIFRTHGIPGSENRLALLITRAGWPRMLGAWLASWIAGGLVLSLFLRRGRILN